MELLGKLLEAQQKIQDSHEETVVVVQRGAGLGTDGSALVQGIERLSGLGLK